MNIQEIISQGKLKSYSLNRSFLEVYWCHPSLEPNQYYLFVFTALKNDLVSVNAIFPNCLPVKYKPKLYVPTIESIMQDLQKLA